MKVLVTGGFGYLGTNICRSLLDNGYDVRIFDLNLPKDSDVDERYDVVLGDILSKEDCKKACSGVDFVIHLAGVSQVACKENPELAENINGRGTKNLLEAAEEEGVKRFIYMSTFHVYGMPSGNISEETKPRPLSEYGRTKLLGENCCVEFNGNMDWVIIRLSNVYSMPFVEQGWKLVVNDLCKHCVDDEKIVLRTRGKQKRDFIAVRDLLQAIDIILNARSEDVSGNIFNLGGDNLLSISELAELIAKTYFEAYGREAKVEFEKDLKEETLIDFVYDIGKIRKLGYEPKADIKKEIVEIFKICEKNKE